MAERHWPGRMLLLAAPILLLFACAAAASASDGDDQLLNETRKTFGALPQVMGSDKNPVTPEKVALGRMLFYETRVSIDGTVSCARCHPIGLYAADGLRKSVGNNCKPLPRNAPTILNAAGQISEHWVGNRTDVEDQAKQALIGPPAFGMPSYEEAEKRLKGIGGYAPLFEKAFPGEKDPVTADNFAMAVGAFERTLLTPSNFDLFINGKKDALADSQKAGLETFMRTGCSGCHSGAYVGGQAYQKFGVFEPYWQYTKSEVVDEGRPTVTNNEADKYVFKVPPLRNVEMTSPYFHDGSVDHLGDAVRIMGKVQLAKSLADQEVEQIVVFLKALTGQIPEDVRRVPALLPSE